MIEYRASFSLSLSLSTSRSRLIAITLKFFSSRSLGSRYLLLVEFRVNLATTINIFFLLPSSVFQIGSIGSERRTIDAAWIYKETRTVAKNNFEFAHRHQRTSEWNVSAMDRVIGVKSSPDFMSVQLASSHSNSNNSISSLTRNYPLGLLCRMTNKVNSEFNISRIVNLDSFSESFRSLIIISW